MVGGKNPAVTWAGPAPGQESITEKKGQTGMGNQGGQEVGGPKFSKIIRDIKQINVSGETDKG